MFNRRIIKYLETWKNRQERKPLILRGARQVGKTVSVRLFGEKAFKDLIQINIEDPEHERLFREPVSLRDFENIIQFKFGKKLIDGETLLFIDEIQNSPALIKMLRFFYEKRPALHVIAAGSLLEAKLKKEGFAFPVGRVEYAYLYPLDFFEFLEALGETELLYASEAKVKYISHCLENAPLFAGQNITYEHFGGSTFHSREIGEAFSALEKAMLVQQIMGCNSRSLPLPQSHG